MHLRIGHRATLEAGPKRLRTVIFWAHLLTGVSAGAIILIMSTTGVLLTYQRQIQAWADVRGMDGAPPSAGAALLPPEALVQRAAAARAGRATAIRWGRDPDAPVEIAYGRESTVFLNGYTGAVLGDGSERARAFFNAVTAWHRWLAQTGDARQRGRAITAAANLAFLFMVLAGFYLWWPRNLTARAFRNVLLFRRGLRGNARDFNWHNVIGIWSLVPLVIVITSAMVISYAWAGALVERIARQEVVETATAAPEPEEPASRVQASPASSPDGAVLLERARAQMPGWRSVTMDLLPRGGAVVFSLDGGSGGQPQRQARLSLSAETGELLEWEPFSSQARPQRVRSLLRFTHTGEVLGIAGQTVAGAVSAGAMVLVWTGLALALRRLRAGLRRRGGSGRSGGSLRKAADGGTKQTA